jgi:rhodanese-related sulfurtransferase
MKLCNWPLPILVCFVTFSGCNKSPAEGMEASAKHDETVDTSPAKPPVAARSGEPCDDWVSGAQARKLVQDGGKLLDVRSPEEFSEEHLEGATNINVEELESRMSELSKDKHLVVYCKSGPRAERAAKMLTDAGYQVSEIGRMDQYRPDAPAGCHD